MTGAVRRLVGWVGVGLLPTFGLGLGPALAGSGAACAAASSGAPHAALVVDTGSSVTSYCVALGGSSINGIQLIQKAGAQFGLPYRLGFGGQAVCMLNGVGGPSGDDCLTGQSSYWGYWITDGSGGWSWSSIGAASTSVHDGDMQGWAWGVGIDGTTHPRPPAVAIGAVCKAPPPPTPKPSGSGEHGENGASGPTKPNPSPTAFATPSARPSPRPNQHHRSPSPHVHAAGARSASPPAAPTLVASGPIHDPGGGSPLGVLLALGFVSALGLGGWLRVRSGGATPR